MNAYERRLGDAAAGDGDPVPATGPDASRPQGEGGLIALAVLSLVVGAAAGLLCALFRLALERVERLREVWTLRAHGHAGAGLLVTVLACAAATALAARLVRRFSPDASGSGIPHVEAVVRGQLPAAPPLLLIPVKFVGGILAIGSGLALGREGPSVQMGASIAQMLGRLLRCSAADSRVLLAAGAGAGLATAFNAPIAGAVFVLEELVQRFEHRIAIAALGASATAIGVARALLGEAPDFAVGALAAGDARGAPLYFLLGALAGLSAIAYNRSILAALAASDRLARRLSVEARAALIGAVVGALAFAVPSLVGGGDLITQRALTGEGSVALVPAAFALRFALGAVSYATGTPGGLFAPLLALGAQIGVFYGAVCRDVFPALELRPEAFALVGMAAFFTGVVRAPLTGLVLVTEMTGNVSLLLPMLGACFAAMLVPDRLGDPPIYEALRERSVRRGAGGDEPFRSPT